MGGADAVDMIENDEGGTYRPVYTACFGQGINTPQQDMNLVRSRQKTAVSLEWGKAS